jgi:DNA mismatch endonuclease (patch repair protein)
VFNRSRVVIECHGCFWQLCPKDAVLPKSNLDYRLPKLLGDAERDRRDAKVPADAGWELIVVWEHENPIAAADRLERILRSRS